MNKMKAKLIKVQDEYWMSTDKQTDFCYHLGYKEILKVTGVGEKSGEVHHEKGWNKPNEVVFIDRELSAKLSLKNCQAIERGYDLDELADDECREVDAYRIWEHKMKSDPYFKIGYKKGFQKALEILGDKKFSEEDMMNCWNEALTFKIHKKTFDEYIQSLQQNEWDVEIEMEYIGDCKGNNNEGCFMDSPGHNCGCFERKPKLDADGCLILKRVV